MKGKLLRIVSALFCLFMIISCAVPGPWVPITNQRRIDPNQAKEQLLSKYVDLIVKTDRRGFETGTAICRRIQKGEIKLDGVLSSENEQYLLYMFRENEDAGLSKGDYWFIAFYFNPLATLVRSCNPEGLCDVYLQNGMTRFGLTNIVAHGKPIVSDQGIALNFTEGRSSAYDLLFSYAKGSEQEGDELITIFLSAFPFLYYQ
jgi:hypothetical protein